MHYSTHQVRLPLLALPCRLKQFPTLVEQIQCLRVPTLQVLTGYSIRLCKSETILLHTNIYVQTREETLWRPLHLSTLRRVRCLTRLSLLFRKGSARQDSLELSIPLISNDKLTSRGSKVIPPVARLSISWVVLKGLVLVQKALIHSLSSSFSFSSTSLNGYQHSHSFPPFQSLQNTQL